MTRGKARKTGNNTGNMGDVENQLGLATKPTLAEDEASKATSKTDELIQQNSSKKMATLDIVLQELRDFHSENGESLKVNREDIQKIDSRMDEAEQRIMESEDRIQNIEDATLELLELQNQVAAKLTDQEGLKKGQHQDSRLKRRSRRWGPVDGRFHRVPPEREARITAVPGTHH